MEDQIKKFEKYITGSLSEREIADFEKILNQDPELNKSFQLYLSEHHHFDQADLKEDSLEIEQQVHAEITDKQTIGKQKNKDYKKKSYTVILLLVLGILVVLAFLFFTGLFEKQKTTPQSIYASEFSVPSMMLKTKGPQALTAYNQKGFQAFSEYKFDLALQLLDTIGTEYDPAVQSQILLAQAISYTEIDSFARSEIYFVFLREKYSHMNATANWYQGLSYLKQGDVEKAKAIMRRIPTSSSYFQRAKEIQDSM